MRSQRFDDSRSRRIQGPAVSPRPARLGPRIRPPVQSAAGRGWKTYSSRLRREFHRRLVAGADPGPGFVAHGPF
eukprot:scaffold8019_cov766-Prasinococcus_capsulatus_cf.AAC.3